MRAAHDSAGSGFPAPISTRRFLFCLFASVSSSLLFASDGLAGDKVEWQLIRYGEVKAGFERIVRSRETKKGVSLHRTDLERTLSYFEGKQINISCQETFFEKDDGSLVEFSYTGVSEAGKTRIHGEVKGGKVYYLVSHPGKSPQEMEIDWNTDTVGPVGIGEIMRSHGFSEGTAYSVTGYSFAVSAPVELSFTVGKREKVRVGDRERMLHCITVRGTDLLGGDGKPLPRTRWVDSNGAFVMERDACFGERTVRVCTQEEAKAPARGVITRAPLHGACGVRGEMIRPRSVSGAVFVLQGPAGFSKLDFKGPGQAASRIAGGLRVNVRVPPNPSSPARFPVTKEKLAPYLQANYFLDYDQEGVQALARRLVRGTKDARKGAEAIRTWTHENLEKKAANSGMATASTAIAVQAGDSVEHAVVVAALCRAVGIPARLAGGLVVSRTLGKIHAWAEVWTGAWTPMDALFEKPFDAARIRLAVSHLNDASADAVVFQAAALLADRASRTTLEVKSYKLNGLTLEPGRVPGSVHRMSGNNYFHTLYGFGFTKPAGFRFQENLAGIDAGVISAMGKGGHRERILFRITSMPYDQTLDDILEVISKNFELRDRKDLTIAGRRAVMVKTSLKGRPGFSPRACYVRDGDTLFTVETTDNTPASRSAFDLALKSLKFKE